MLRAGPACAGRANQMGQDRASILKAMNQAVTRLYVQEDTDDGDAQAA